MVVIPRLVYNFNHSKPGPFAEKSLLKQTLEHKASRRTIGELCFSFLPSDADDNVTPRSSTWFPLIFPWKSGDSGEIHDGFRFQPFNFVFFCMEDSIPSYHFFRPIWCFEITKTARCFSRVIFCWRQDLFFQRWNIMHENSFQQNKQERKHLLWLHPFTKLTCFLKRGHFKVKVVFQPLFFFWGGACFFSGELSWPKKNPSNPSRKSELQVVRLGQSLGWWCNYAPWKRTSKNVSKNRPPYCWWFRNPANSPVEGTVVFLSWVVVWDVFHQQ